MPWVRPIDVVVLPSPAGVGVIAETRINFPGSLPAAATASGRTLALSRPYGSRKSSAISRSRATSTIGLNTATSVRDIRLWSSTRLVVFAFLSVADRIDPLIEVDPDRPRILPDPGDQRDAEPPGQQDQSEQRPARNH